MPPKSNHSSLRIGLIGTGTISGIYLQNARDRFAGFDIVGVADLVRERAEAQAAQFGIPRVLSVEELLADPDIDCVLNLTIPAAHHTVSKQAILAGKHVYTEKPLAVEPPDGDDLVALAAAHGVRIGAAPDTFLGAGIQTCRRLLDEGAIGEPVGAAICFASHGNEHWHPNPEFSYEHGGGPVYNFGPYYYTALVSLLGPVSQVTGFSRASFPTRTISSQPLAGQLIDVKTPTFINAALQFVGGPVASVTYTYDVWATERPRIEIYGSEGTLSVPDPNTFAGPVRLYRQSTREWEDVALDSGFTENSRGLGIADLAVSLQSGTPHRANGTLANHVLEVINTTQEAGNRGSVQVLHTSCERPAPLKPDSIELIGA